MPAPDSAAGDPVTDGSQSAALGNIPPGLRELPQWVPWNLVERDGAEKPTKLPVNPHTGGAASSTNPATWGTFQTAMEYQQADGVGFVFTPDDPYVGIDLDGCRDPETGQLTAEASAIVERLNSYTEVSPSGTGLHIIVRGELPPGGRRKGGVEMYQTGRYFTMTGDRAADTPAEIHDRGDELVALHIDVFGAPPAPLPPSPPPPVTNLDDAELIERASKAHNGAKFAALWAGSIDGYDSPSEADLALCNLLAFWAGPDPDRIERLFSQSGLYREKWDQKHGERTYGEITSQRAVEGRSEFYTTTDPACAATIPALTNARTQKPTADVTDPEVLAFLRSCAPVFPVESLPDEIREYVVTSATSVGVPVEIGRAHV